MKSVRVTRARLGNSHPIGRPCESLGQIMHLGNRPLQYASGTYDVYIGELSALVGKPFSGAGRWYGPRITEIFGSQATPAERRTVRPLRFNR